MFISHLCNQKPRLSVTLERFTKVAIILGFFLLLLALSLIGFGSLVSYFNSLLSVPPGPISPPDGSSFISAGYAIIAILVIIFVAIVGLAAYRHYNSSHQGYRDGW